MQHLNEETLVAHHYHDDDNPAAVRQHLRECATCSAEYDEIRRVLAMVSEAEIPERGEDYGTAVWTRLRLKLGSERRRRNWQSFVAAAAALVLVFFLGQWWHARNTAKAPGDIATATGTNGVQPASIPRTNAAQQDRILLVVIGDHLDSSERMLVEIANADVDRGLRLPADRAGELVASNRIYRQTAARRGDARIANVLSDLEPILVELSHAGTTVSGDELAELQKRIEAKGLLFKVRVIGAAPAARSERAHDPNTTSL